MQRILSMRRLRSVRASSLSRPSRPLRRDQRRDRQDTAFTLRRGFTLVELLVAVVLLNIGVLALVGSSAALVRRHTVIRLRAVAERRMESRLEELTMRSCGATAGTLDVNGSYERWSATSISRSVRELADSIAFIADGSTQSLSLRTRALC